MSNSKSERILNLFFVLLNTKRPLSRSELKQKVNGYEESESETAFERMFERDKDELRTIGIRIQTLPIDPLFDDELGYKIDPSIFLTKQTSWTDEERYILNLASALWHETEFEYQAKVANIKVGSLVSADSDSLTQDLKGSIDIYKTLLLALQKRDVISFAYLANDEDVPAQRKIIPRKLYRKDRFWYLEGFDIKTSLIKNYQINRIFGDIEQTKSSEIERNLVNKIEEKNNSEMTTTIEINQNPQLITHIIGGEILDENRINMQYFEAKSLVKFLLTISSVIIDIEDKLIKDSYIDTLTSFRKVLL
jgi:predicted DNA-binding transcriptional regulator YafY